MRLLISVSTMVMLCLLIPVTTAQEEDDAADVDPILQAQTFVDHLVAGEYQAAIARYDDAMTAALSLAQTQSVWESVIGQFGPYQALIATSVQAADPNQVVTLTTQFENGALNLLLTINPDGQVAGFFIQPTDLPEPAPMPDYINPDAFSETEVIVGEDSDWELPGTLAMPVDVDEAVPAVIILGGSGPTDRDSTYGPNKPLRDIAQGLASQGIAVLRYDKRPTVYGQRMMEAGALTLQEEYIDDALNAIALLQNTEGIDTERIYLLGHSLGGNAAPRVAAQAPDDAIAGLILAAASAHPLHETTLRQVRYLAELDGEISDEEQAQIDAIAQMVTQINEAAEADMDEINITQAVLGVPLAYWLDLLANDPVAITAALDLPVLIVQGERDYQVTLEDDLSLWREGLADEDNVTITTYPGLNHLFMPGEGVGNPQEYDTPGSVAPDVIADIAAWVNMEQ